MDLFKLFSLLHSNKTLISPDSQSSTFLPYFVFIYVLSYVNNAFSVFSELMALSILH